MSSGVNNRSPAEDIDLPASPGSLTGVVYLRTEAFASAEVAAMSLIIHALTPESGKMPPSRL